MSQFKVRPSATFEGKKVPAPTDARYTMTIDFLHNGQIRMTGPLTQPKLCNAMLQDALKIVNEHYPASVKKLDGENSVIVPDRQIILPGV